MLDGRGTTRLFFVKNPSADVTLYNLILANGFTKVTPAYLQGSGRCSVCEPHTLSLRQDNRLDQQGGPTNPLDAAVRALCDRVPVQRFACAAASSLRSPWACNWTEPPVTLHLQAGAAILLDQGALIVTNCTVRNCNATTEGKGGGVNSRGALIVTDSVLDGNVAGRGGAINQEGGSLTLINTVLESNKATAGNAVWRPTSRPYALGQSLRRWLFACAVWRGNQLR